MDDEDWMYEESPNDVLRFHVIVIDSNVQTWSPYNRITEIGCERSIKDRSLVVNFGGSGPKVPKEGLDADLTKLSGAHAHVAHK